MTAVQIIWNDSWWKDPPPKHWQTQRREERRLRLDQMRKESLMLELERAYPLLKEQWRDVHGTIRKLKWEGEKGAPDFLLLSTVRPPTFAEVKCTERLNDIIPLEPIQAYGMDALHKLQCHVRLLTLCLETNQWYMHFPTFYRSESEAFSTKTIVTTGTRRIMRCSDFTACCFKVLTPVLVADSLPEEKV